MIFSIMFPRGKFEIMCFLCFYRVWSWGWGVHGQLGHGSVEDQLIPQVVGSLVGKDIVQIGAGACHSGVLSADGKVKATNHSSLSRP